MSVPGLMPSNFVFDFGGVVFSHKHRSVVAYIQDNFNLYEGKDYVGSQIWSQASQSNYFLSDEFWEDYAFLLGLQKSIGQELFDVFISSNEVFSIVEEFILVLKSKSYKVYYLTNTKKEIFESRKTAPIFQCFDGGVTDIEAGTSKPSEKIYQYLFDKYNIKPEKTVFLDDKEDNINTAIRLNAKGFLFDSTTTTLDDLLKLIELN
jgi:FMN phosphatase YigB (HAD superfamily)